MSTPELITLLSRLGVAGDDVDAVFTRACETGRAVARTQTGMRVVTYNATEYTFKVARRA